MMPAWRDAFSVILGRITPGVCFDLFDAKKPKHHPTICTPIHSYSFTLSYTPHPPLYIPIMFARAFSRTAVASRSFQVSHTLFPVFATKARCPTPEAFTFRDMCFCTYLREIMLTSSRLPGHTLRHSNRLLLLQPLQDRKTPMYVRMFSHNPLKGSYADVCRATTSLP